MTVYRLHNPVRNYAWGSHTAIATLQGRGPAAEPEAELWIGAHPTAPSEAALADGSVEPLHRRIATAPDAHLGPEVLADLGDQLPFLLKVLAADLPLSLQVHPSAEQAQAGWADEEAAGIPAGERRFCDPRAKPELLVAVAPFDALQGFRPAAEAAALVRRLGVGRLAWLAEALEGGEPTGAVFLRLVATGAAPDLVREVADAAAERAAAGDPDQAVLRRLPGLAAAYPDDPAVAGVLLLNHVRLEPGDGAYVAAGTIHAYLEGVGVEIMGNSDNVFRAGLTAKPVDIDALAATLQVAASPPVVVRPTSIGPGCERWETPAPEFALSRLRVSGGQAPVGERPALALCLDGAVTLTHDGGELALASGDAAFVGADAGSVRLAGAGTVMWASHGLRRGGG